MPGLASAAVGAGLSVANVFVLTGVARKAVAVAAAAGPTPRSSADLDAGREDDRAHHDVWVLGKSASLRAPALASGSWSLCFCLLAAGLVTARRTE
jgi:hypothetical protein